MDDYEESQRPDHDMLDASTLYESESDFEKKVNAQMDHQHIDKGKKQIIENELSPVEYHSTKVKSRPTTSPKTPSNRQPHRSNYTGIDDLDIHQTPKHQKRTQRKLVVSSDTDEDATEETEPNTLICTPLKQIVGYYNSHNVLVRVTKLWFGKLYGKQHPKALVFLAKDQQGTTIEVIGIGSEVDRWKALLIPEQTYTITNVLLGISDKPFKAYRSNEQLFLQPESCIIPCADDYSIAFGSTYYHKLCQVQHLAATPQNLISIIGHVVDMSRPRRMDIRSRKDVSKIVELWLIDETAHEEPTTFSVWEDVYMKHESMLANGFKSTFILVAHDVRAKPFDGKFILESTGFSKLECNVSNTKETKHLLRWIEKEYPKQYHQQNELPSQSTDDGQPILTLAELMHGTQYEPAEDDTKYYNVTATVVYIFPGRDMIYETCPKCNRKAPPMVRGEYKCNGCYKVQTKTLSSYKVRTVLEDDRNQIFAMLFGAQAQLIVGEPVHVIKDLLKKNNAEALIRAKLKDSLGITYNFKIKLNSKNFRFIHTTGYTVTAARRAVRDYKPKRTLLQITDGNEVCLDLNAAAATSQEAEVKLKRLKKNE